MTAPPEWIDGSGKPSAYSIRAALHAATLLDESGSHKDDARESYWRHAIGGAFSPADLHVGEQLLVDCELLQEKGNLLFPTAILQELLNGTVEDAIVFLSALTTRLLYKGEHPSSAQVVKEMARQLGELIPDAARREEALIALSQRFDDLFRRTLGEIGEEIVLDSVREELKELGYPELARAARRVSLLSDQLGYDISAPRISGSQRLLEVKSTSIDFDGSVKIYISRNEANTAIKVQEWSLVLCRILDVERRSGEIVGWCNGNALKDLFPTDTQSGHWEQAALDLPLGILVPGLPRPS